MALAELDTEDMGECVASDPHCLSCGEAFQRGRKDKKYCSTQCAKAATRNATRGCRQSENRARSKAHYGRAAWLSYDTNRLPPRERRTTLLALLEAASGADTTLRNILLDPALLGAGPVSPIGKLYPDTKYYTARNIAQMVNALCQQEWGCSVRDAILDHGKQAGRAFKDALDPVDVANVPPHIYEKTFEVPLLAYVNIKPATVLAFLKASWGAQTKSLAA